MSSAPEETPEEAAARMMADRQWPVIIKLAHPIDFAGQHITSLEFRRGKMGDLKGMKPGDVPDFGQLALIASRMCGQQTQVIEALADDDAAEVVEIALGFFGRCLGAGRKRSRP